MRKKLKDSSGLTMVEMLCAVLILLLLCMMMNTGLGMAMKSYRDITGVSEADLLLSSISDALADKLRYTVVTETPGADPSGDPDYTWSVGGVTVTPDPADPTSDPIGIVKVGGRKLLPDGAYGKGRYQVTAATVTPEYSGETPVFTINLEVKDTVTGSITAKTDLVIRCLNPMKKEPTT